ncbi:hypothetical protein NVP1247A_47 [Vibrio phage 1.247.A._10N.261.54.E12]|nr:hypothetical protein NVP1247A_47 [Vibrio phage 1.247.A._10N.261.54.E12]AUR98191.1 hypothetical protein NVP1247B_47 [Vibrio phage 1.247.B._10N.261.54.E12]
MIDAHTFKVEDAIEHGIEKAVLLYNLRYWISKNIANNKHAHDGFVWTYNSQEAFSRLFPYMSPQKIGRILRSMEEDGLISSANYNRAGYDRTKWYTIPSMFIVQNQTMDGLDLNDGSLNSEQPIPNNYQLTSSSKESFVQAKPKRSKFKFESEDLRFSQEMFKRIEVVAPNAKKPNFESWANTIRLMRESDKRDHKTMWAVFDWANKDSFWCSNVLSPDKLRKQFDKLQVKVNETNQPRTNASNASGLSSAQSAIAAARQQRDAAQSGSPMGFNERTVHGQVDSEEWSGRVYDVD